MRCICRHFARSDRSYLDSLCTVIGRGGEQLHSFLAFLLHAAGEGFGEGVDPQTGGAIAWDGKEAAQVGEGEEGGPVGGAEPGDPSLAGEAVLPMKLRVEVGDLFIGLCAALLIVFGACLWPPKVVPKEADIGGSCWYCWRRHIQYTSKPLFAFFDLNTGGVFLST